MKADLLEKGIAIAKEDTHVLALQRRICLCIFVKGIKHSTRMLATALDLRQ